MLPIPAKFRKALTLHQAGALAQAQDLYREILSEDPAHFDSCHLLGTSLIQTGRARDGLEMILKALQLQPGNAEAHYNLAHGWQKLGNLDAALACIASAISLSPGDPEYHFEKANVLKQLNRFEDAVAGYARALALKPDYAEAHNNQGIVLRELQRFEEALASYDKAIGLRPGYAEAHSNRGNVLKDLDRLEEAVASHDKAISLRPRYAAAYCNRGNALKELDRLDAALASYDQAIALKPDYAEAYGNRGVALRELNRLDEALAAFDTAISLKPDYAEAYGNRAVTLKELGRLDEALADIEKAIGLAPGDTSFIYSRGYFLLLKGRFSEGLEDYEVRKPREKRPTQIITSAPLWRGAGDLSGKRLLVYWEQGLGDTIQFSRYVPLLRARGAEVLFSPQKPLRRLMQQLAGVGEIVDEEDPALAYDLRIPLLTSMLAFKTDLASIPNSVPYLKPEPERVNFWRQAMGRTAARLTIGICWQGSRNKIDRGRSFPLENFHRISRIPGVRLISLHKGVGESQLAAVPPGMKVDTLGPGFDAGPDAFVDTAAVISLCDLVITSDTAVAHLAGALGAPSWVALKHVPDWRWMMAGDNSPWYPTMRLFRQESAGDWPGVFARIESEISRLMS